MGAFQADGQIAVAAMPSWAANWIVLSFWAADGAYTSGPRTARAFFILLMGHGIYEIAMQNAETGLFIQNQNL